MKKLLQRLGTAGKLSVVFSLASVLILELFEEALEEGIALGVSWVITKTISVVFVVAVTQSIKVVIKKTVKLIFYKKGADKMEKLKTFFNKLALYLKTNPITIGTSAANVAGSSGVGYAVYTLLTAFNVAIPSWALYAIVAVSSVIVACLVEWGILKQGWETTEQKALRLAEAKAKAEAAKIEAEAKAAIKAQEEEARRLEEEAVALIKAEAEAAAKAIADAEAQAKKEAHDKLVAEKLAEIRARQVLNNNIEE